MPFLGIFEGMYQDCELGSVSFVQGCVASSKEALTVLGLDPP